MHKYVFNARDIAAYIKYFSVPTYLEVSYMQYIFNIGTPVLAVPLTRDFEKFKGEVYRELYFLWANGFESEKDGIEKMIEQGQLSLICDQECINLESYMKLITLHLIYTKSLPYVQLNFTGLPLSLGIRCEFSVFEENVVKVISGMNLVVSDRFGRPFDLNLGVPDELLSISLSEEFKQAMVKGKDIREQLKSEEKEKMAALKESSLKEFGSIPMREKKTSKKTKKKADKKPEALKDNTVGGRSNSKSTSFGQPKGAPLKGTGRKPGAED